MGFRGGGQIDPLPSIFWFSSTPAGIGLSLLSSILHPIHKIIPPLPRALHVLYWNIGHWCMTTFKPIFIKSVKILLNLRYKPLQIRTSSGIIQSFWQNLRHGRSLNLPTWRQISFPYCQKAYSEFQKFISEIYDFQRELSSLEKKCKPPWTNS